MPFQAPVHCRGIRDGQKHLLSGPCDPDERERELHGPNVSDTLKEECRPRRPVLQRLDCNSSVDHSFGCGEYILYIFAQSDSGASRRSIAVAFVLVSFSHFGIKRRGVLWLMAVSVQVQQAG